MISLIFRSKSFKYSCIGVTGCYTHYMRQLFGIPLYYINLINAICNYTLFIHAINFIILTITYFKSNLHCDILA